MKFLLDIINNAFKTTFNNENKTIDQPKQGLQQAEPVHAPILTLDLWITSSNKYPERAKSDELTYEVKSAAMVLVDKINELGRRLNLNSLSVSSGFRPTKINSTIPGAAKSSGHTKGLAVDFEDKDGKLKALIASKPEILRELGLFMEAPGHTPTWCHLDYINRTDRPNRQFNP